MPKTISFEEWKQRRRQPRRHPPPCAYRQGLPQERRRRPRHDDEWEALCQIALARKLRYLASGKLEPLPQGGYGKLEPLPQGGYRWHLGRQKLIEYERNQAAKSS